jgi:hypothetical protein
MHINFFIWYKLLNLVQQCYVFLFHPAQDRDAELGS